jgi:hypothetical protein
LIFEVPRLEHRERNTRVFLSGYVRLFGGAGETVIVTDTILQAMHAAQDVALGSIAKPQNDHGAYHGEPEIVARALAQPATLTVFIRSSVLPLRFSSIED